MKRIEKKLQSGKSVEEATGAPGKYLFGGGKEAPGSGDEDMEGTTGSPTSQPQSGGGGGGAGAQ